MTKKLSETIRKQMHFIMDVGPLNNATELAEETAWAFGKDKWLNDPDHEVWEIALEFFD